MVPMNMDTDVLRTFITIVEQNGFNNAGIALGRSQSAVSMQMKRLEEITQCNLFERHGRQRKLTTSGEILLGYARRLVLLHDQALNELHEHLVVGEVKLAVMGDYATQILPEILARFISHYPKIKVEVTTGYTSELIKQLGERFDLVLATQPKGIGTGQVLRTEKTRWAYSANHPLSWGDVVPLALLTPGNMFREWALTALNDAGVRWRITFTSSSISAVEAVAEAGIAVTVAKEGTARSGLKFLGPSDGFPNLPESEIALYHAPGKRAAAVSTLSDYLAASLKS